MPRRTLAAAALGALLAAGATAHAAPHRREGEVLVRLREGQARSATPWKRGGLHGEVRRAYRSVPGLHQVTLPPGLSVEQAIARLQADPSVAYAEPNYEVEALAIPNDPHFGDLWGMHNTGQLGGTPDVDIDAPEAWDITTGSASVVVAVIDSGIVVGHPDIAPNLFRNEPECVANGVDDDGNGWIDDCNGIDARDEDGDPAPTGEHGFFHGTHVAGTIGAAGNNGEGVAGVAWTVRLLACRFIGPNGTGTLADAITCLDYVKLMRERGVNIVASNNSWGSFGGYSQALRDAIDAQREAGILFVAAAGNSAHDSDQFASYPAS
jgi:subtilisin family serine protease